MAFTADMRGYNLLGTETGWEQRPGTSVSGPVGLNWLLSSVSGALELWGSAMDESRLKKIMALHVRAERIARGFEQALSGLAFGLTYPHFRLLGCVIVLGPISLKEAADALQLPKTTCHYIMAKLENGGYLERAGLVRAGIPAFTATHSGKVLWAHALERLIHDNLGQTLSAMSDTDLNIAYTVGESLIRAFGYKDAGPERYDEVTAMAYLAHKVLNTGWPEPFDHQA